MSLFDLFGSRESRIEEAVRSISPTLIRAASAIGVTLYGHDGGGVPAHLQERDIDSKFYGYYSVRRDLLAVSPRHLVEERSGVTVNMVLAHELIHATGHAKRINRGYIGLATDPATAYKLMVFAPPEKDRHSEEVVAQHGGLLLLRSLSLALQSDEKDTIKYLRRHGREDGQPNDAERIEAVRAVKYVLSALESFEGKESRDDRESA